MATVETDRWKAEFGSWLKDIVAKKWGQVLLLKVGEEIKKNGRWTSYIRM